MPDTGETAPTVTAAVGTSADESFDLVSNTCRDGVEADDQTLCAL